MTQSGHRASLNAPHSNRYDTHVLSLGAAMRRREFIRLLGGAAAIPIAARAQQAERVRRIGVLMYLAEDDPRAKALMAAFIEGLQQLDWTIGRNVQIDIRWGAADP